MRLQLYAAPCPVGSWIAVGRNFASWPALPRNASEIRARQLTGVFSGARYHNNPHVFSKPDALFYFQMEHKYHGVSHQRCYETLKYVSEKLALPRQPLHETHTHEGNRHAAAWIRASPARVVLVAWEHRNIPLLAEALGYSDSNPEFKQELEKCHSKLGGWPTDADFDFVYTFSYGAGSDRLVGFSCRHEGVTPFIPADAVRQLQQTRRLLSISH